MKTPVNFSSFASILAVQLLLLSLALGAAFNAGAAPAAADTQSGISQITVRNKINELNSNQQLDAALKIKLLETYQSALAHLQAAETYQAQTKSYEQALKLAPAQLKELKKNIEKVTVTLKTVPSEAFDGIPTEELEQRLIIERSRLSDLNSQAEKLETELTLQSGRMAQIRLETIALQEKLDATDNSLKTARNGEQKLENEARVLQLRSLQSAQMAELKVLESEALSNSPRVEVLKAQYDLLHLQSEALAPTINRLEETLSERRQQEAEKMQQELSLTEQALSGKHPVIHSVTHENLDFGRDLRIITEKIAQRSAEQEEIAARNAQIDKDFKSAEQKIALAGLSPALGKILREQRRDLPSTRELEAESQQLQNEIAKFSYEQFRVEDRLKKLGDINGYLKDLQSEQVDAALPPAERMQIQAELRMLLNIQKELLTKLLSSYSSYLRLMGDLDFARQQTIGLAERYAAFLDKRLLWVPSSPAVRTGFFADIYYALKWLLDPRNWLQVSQELGHELREYPWLAIFGIVGLAGLFALKRQAKLKLAEISSNVLKPYSDKFSYTLQTFGYNLVLAAPLPLSFYFVGWLLKQDLSMSEFTHATGEGFCAAALPLFSMQFLYIFTHPQGLVAVHLQWREQTRKLLRKLIAWFRFVIVPAVFLIAMTGAQSNAGHSDGLGRLALILLLLASVLAIKAVLKFKGGILEQYFNEFPHSWITRLRYLWYPAFLAIPLTMSGFALLGYYVSALELEHKFIVSVRLIVAAIVLYGLVVRWLSLVNRKLAIIKARQKREADLAAKTSSDAAEEPLALTQESIDIPTINAQTRQMLKVLIVFGFVVSLWLVWADVLPALAILDNIVFWQQTVVVGGVETLQAVTLINVLLAGFYAFILFMALRNLPGMLEVLMIKQLSVEPGNRYAVNQLARYSLLAIGVISIANELGGSWKQIQWLVAALGVGLGFGLQEIFANLVSGIILLFERPMRVGDTVTVGDVSGRVCRIQMRATTIVDWDQKELIVPNKTFITSQLVNWTLSDQITRLVVEIGVAYGSDTALVHEVLTKTVDETPLVLKEPAPSVFFTGFGESALHYTIRVFVNELGNRLPLTHDLHMRIERALREHHIEIPFPQRDIHVRSIVRNPPSRHE